MLIRRWFEDILNPVGCVKQSNCHSYSETLVFGNDSLSWNKGITDLAAINFQLSFQCVLIFVVGLFATNRTDVHPWCLSIGAIVSSIYVSVLYFGYINDNDDSIAVNAGVTGLVLQVMIALPLEACRRIFLATGEFHPEEDERDLIFPYRPAWDIPPRARFGDCALTPNLLNRMMDGVSEPLANPWFAALMFFTISFMTPIVPPGMPEEIGAVAVVNGLPWWVFKMLVLGLVPFVLLLFALYQMPRSYSNPESKRDEDPYIMELTREELGHRVVYDRQNELVARRRREALERLGLLPREIDNIVTSNPATQLGSASSADAEEF